MLQTDPSGLSVYMDDFVVRMVDNLVEKNEELDVVLGQGISESSGWIAESNDEDFDFDSNNVDAE